MEFPLLLGLIVLNGLFAMAEIALVTARKARLQRMVDDGDRAAAAAIRLGEDPTRFLSTIQIGITSIGILNGIVGESAMAGPIARELTALGMSAESARLTGTGLAVLVITYLSIVLGELVPKRIGQMTPEGIARRVAKPMLGLAALTKPFGRLLTGSTNLILKLIPLRPDTGPAVTEDEIHAMLEEGSSAGVIDEHERTMVRNVFRLDEREIASLMVPRSDVVYLDVQDALEDNLRKIETSEYSRFPVCQGGWHNVLGLINSKSLLRHTLRGEMPSLETLLHPAIFVPETVTAIELLDNFRSSRVHIALVVDEYGEVQGLVTLQDVLEAITGEFMPQNQEDRWAVQREDGSWLLDGSMPVPELKDVLALRTVPDEERSRYHTLSGMLMLLLGRVPATADHVEWGGWRFEIVDMDGNRIDKVLASRVEINEEAPPE